jgi:hypothetical protein
MSSEIDSRVRPERGSVMHQLPMNMEGDGKRVGITKRTLYKHVKRLGMVDEGPFDGGITRTVVKPESHS